MNRIVTVFTSLFCLLFGLHPTSAQESIEGVINHYTSALSYEDCSGQVCLSSSNNFSVGEQIVIIQMTGGEVSTTDSDDYGAIESIGAVGLYELATIADIDGDCIFLAHRLLHEYDFTHKVQVVTFPKYEDVTVTAMLTAQPWNGTTGGILAFKANSVVLEANIDVSGLGYRGGEHTITETNNCSWIINHDNYAYNAGNWRGARKGESFVPFIADQEAGRGRWATGGGGANDHNAGGGGGANRSMGGLGGRNKEPSTFGCDGDFPGFGGDAVSLDYGMQRLFLGGGGGAGHENNGVGTSGGNGGGIVIIQANSLNGEYDIISKGADANDATGDGAGGGGAAGTLALDINNLAFEVNCIATGGNGGDADNDNAERCMGPGAGGSGGYIIYPSSLPNVNVNAGFAGMSINSTACGETTNEATHGVFGVYTSGLIIPQSTEEVSIANVVAFPDETIFCEGDSDTIEAEVVGSGLSFDWFIDWGFGFTPIEDNATFSGSNTATLTINNVESNFDGASIFLAVSDNCNNTVNSTTSTIMVSSLTVADFDYSINGLEVNFTNLSEHATSWQWNFGDGETSDLDNPNHIYTTTGIYDVTLTSFNECGQDQITIPINLAPIPQADFSSSETAGCAPWLVNFTSESLGGDLTYAWNFPGGNPVTSTDATPQIIYDSPGIYDIQLIVDNGFNKDTVIATQYIEVVESPVAMFDYDITGNIVEFTNQSLFASSWLWDFGDGNTSTAENPIHEYATLDYYQVTLNAYNQYCGMSAAENISLIVSTNDLANDDFSIYPNPTIEELHILSEVTDSYHIRIYDSLGRLQMMSIASGKATISVNSLPNGIYLLQLSQNEQLYTHKLIIAK